MRSGPYSEELKQEIIQLNLEEKRSIKNLSMEYGYINKHNIQMAYHLQKSKRERMQQEERLDMMNVCRRKQI